MAPGGTTGPMKQRELVGIWAALFILCAVAVLSYRSIDAAADTLVWVEHTHRVLRQIDDVSAAYARSIAARRAYVLAGDQSQLAEAPAFDARLAGAIAVLRT